MPRLYKPSDILLGGNRDVKHCSALVNPTPRVKKTLFKILAITVFAVGLVFSLMTAYAVRLGDQRLAECKRYKVPHPCAKPAEFERLVRKLWLVD